MGDAEESTMVTEKSQSGKELAVIPRPSAGIADFFIPWDIAEREAPQRGNRALSRTLRRRLTVAPASADQLLTDMLGKQQARRYCKLSFWRSLQANGCGLLTLASLPVSVGAGVAWLASAAAASSGAGNIAIVSIASSLLFGANAWRAARAAYRDDQELSRLAAERFARWVEARYGLKVQADELSKSLGQAFIKAEVRRVRRPEAFIAHMTFRTTDGEKYTLAGEAGKLYVEGFVPKSKKRKRAKAAKKAARELDLKPLLADGRFSSEATVLISQIGELLVKVSSAPLDAEQEHVVKRAQQDVLGLARLNGQLHELRGPSAEDERNFASTLLTLRDELQGVIKQQHAALSKEVRITAAYVSERQRSPRLSLNKNA